MSTINSSVPISSEPVYSCSELLNQYENDLEFASASDFQMLEHRIDVLLTLINCGIEYTALSQLNQIH